MIYFKEEKLKEFKKVNKDDLFVVTDFDQTLTNSLCSSTWEILSQSIELPESYHIKREELRSKYHPFEIDPKLSREEKIPYLEKWWKNGN